MAPTPENPSDTGAADAPDAPGGGATTGLDRQPLRLRGVTTVVLALLCLVAAGVAGVSLWRDEEARTAVPTTGPVTSVSARQSGAAAAGDLSAQVLTYGWRTLDQDAARVRRVSSPSFARQYDRTMTSVRAQTVRTKVTLTAEAVGVGVVTASPTRVVALVYIDQTTRTQGSRRTRQDQNRVLVTVTADGGEWRVSRMDAF